MEYVIKTDNDKQVKFLFNPALNLVSHTSNLLGISLGGRGSKNYFLRNDESANNAINYHGKVNHEWFSDLTKILVEQNISSAEKAIILLEKYYPDKTIVEILRNSWNGFYKDYWNKREKELEKTFVNIITSRNWKNTLKIMEDITDSKFNSDFYILSVEATANSATMIKPNISIGTLRNYSDCGFVHEGLHLLFEQSKNYKDVADYLKSHSWTSEHSKKFPYNDWRGKIEQAVVISLDCLISNIPEKYINNYFNGCRVLDIKDVIFPEIKKWYESTRKTKLNEFLLDLLKRREKEIFT